MYKGKVLWEKVIEKVQSRQNVQCPDYFFLRTSDCGTLYLI